MPRPRKPRPTLADVVDLLNVDDVIEPPSTLADLAEKHPDRADLALAYLRLRPSVHGDKAQTALHAIHWVMIPLGLAVGAGIASAALYYDGSQPINLFYAFGLMVVLPAVFMLLSIILMLPSIAPIKALQRGVLLLHPGRLLAWLTDRFSTPFAAFRAKQSLLGPVSKWMLINISQSFGLWVAFGIYLAASVLAGLSDLTFAWGSTFELQPETIHTAVRWIDPIDPPSLEAVERLRYYRFSDIGYPDEPFDPTIHGDWAAFLLHAVFCYGLVLRFILAMMSKYRFRAAVQRAFINAPETDQLASLILSRAVSTRATEAEVAATDQPVDAPTTRVHDAVRISWADADPHAEHHAGGGRSLDEDEATIDAIATSGGGGDVVIVVDANEPPLLEFADFIKALRKRIGDLRTIAVEPRGGDATQWQSTVARIGDPHLFIAEGSA